MRTIVIGTRVLLALVFIAAGLAGFFLDNSAPAPGWATDFQTAYVIAGILLLIERYVPLAVVVFAAAAIGQFAPLLLTALWLIGTWPLRSRGEPQLAAKAAA